MPEHANSVKGLSCTFPLGSAALQFINVNLLVAALERISLLLLLGALHFNSFMYLLVAALERISILLLLGALHFNSFM